MRNPLAKETAVCREIERVHGGEINRGGGIVFGCALGLVAWTLLLLVIV